jgi:hypothetical protein
MSRSRSHIQAAVLLFILLPAVAGVVAVHASATCERFVRTYVTKPVRNRVSKTTAEAWAKWRIEHPNWKPNPNLHRPKYVMNREEAVQKVAFACTVPVIPITSERAFLPDEFEIPPPIVNLPRMDATEIAFPDQLPEEVAEITPDDSWPPLGPFVPPILGGPPTPFGGTPVFPIVPPEPPPITGTITEPASLLLAGTGIGCLFLLLGARIRRDNETTA